MNAAVLPVDPITTEQIWNARLVIYQGEDWVEALPQFVDQHGNPFSLAGVTLELYILPVAAYTPRIAKITSAGSAGIIISDPADGLAEISVEQTTVDSWPLGEWWNFMNMTFTDPDLGVLTKTLWRGPCLIMPDETTSP